MAFTRALARELSGTGICVNAIAQGFTLIEGVRSALNAQAIVDIAAAWHGKLLSEELRDLNGALLLLACEGSDLITGQTINANGGAAHNVNVGAAHH